METKALTRLSERMPSVFDDFFKPWNEWYGSGGFWGRVLEVPAVNITEQKNEYLVALAAPGMKKDDFRIDVDGYILTISAQKEENKEEEDKKFTRREYSYSTFSRSFTLPDEVNKEKIEAKYVDGILRVALPKKDEVKMPAAKQIAIN
jgi:HSP20 family protein